MKFVASYASEAEIGTLFMNAKEGRIIWITLEELGHTHSPTPINCDNATSAGIENGTLKRQRSRSTEMRYFYIWDQVKKGEFELVWNPGK